MLSFEQKASQTVCRSCGKTGLEPVLDLGVTALVDTLVTADKLQGPEARHPLRVGFCPGCALVQVLDTVPPDEVFHADYAYFSSFSETLLDHSRKNALELIVSQKLDGNSLVIELASNDGYLLKNFVEQGVPVLGIDPCPGPAEAARKIGVPTICDFFGSSLAEKLVAEGKQADVVIANNVMAHVADLNGFVAGIAKILKPGGVLVTESPWLKDLIDHCEFDTIYHEHLGYYSVTSLDHLFRRHGLWLNDVRQFPIHGGTIRSYVGKREDRQPGARQLLELEHRVGVDRIDYYRNFADRVKEIRRSLLEMLQDLKAKGKHVAAYGASAKGSTLLSYLGAGPELVEFVVDKNIHKHGKFMPGTHNPILSPQAIADRKPDYLLLLVWNLKDEILRQQAAYRQAGGKFIIPIPTPEIV